MVKIMQINNVVLCGIVLDNPRIKREGTISSCSLIIDYIIEHKSEERSKDYHTFIKCVFVGNLALDVFENVKKGNTILINGKITNSTRNTLSDEHNFHIKCYSFSM